MIARIVLLTAACAAFGAVVGLAYLRFAPPVYEAHGLVIVNPGNADLQRAAVTVLKSPALLASAAKAAPANSKSVNLAENAKVVPSSGNVLELKVDSASKTTATKIVDAWIKAYAGEADKTNHNILAGKLKEKQLAMSDAKIRLDGVEHNIAALKKKTGIADVNLAISGAATYEGNLNQQRDQDQAALETTKRQAEQERKQLALMPKTTEEKVTETVDPVVRNKEDHLASLQQEKIRLLANWLPTSKVITDLDFQIKATIADIATAKRLSVEHRDTSPNPQRRALEESYTTHLAQIAGFTGSINEVNKALTKLKATSASLPGTQLDMARLTREQAMDEGVYKGLRAEYDSLLSGTTAPTLPILSPMAPAEASPQPIFPRFDQCLAWGAGIGAVLGFLVGLAIRPQPSPESQSIGAELPVHVTAPPLPARRGDGLELLSLPSANPAEAYRFMVFSLQSRGDQAKTILFTGVSHDSLCAEASAQFAVAMSQTGVRTLLIDCNLRDPSLTKAFGFLGKSGITDILSRTMLPSASNDLVLETSHPDLFFLPAGTLESEGIGGFQNLQVQGMLHEVMDRAEIKVVNMPACGLVSDASRLARHADQVCLVANRHDHAKGLVAKAESILKLAGAKEVEIVLIDEKRSRDSFLA